MKNHILKLSSYPLSWKQYRFCKNDFPPTNSHLLLLPLFLRTSHLNGNLVFYKMCISNFESCACSLLGSHQKGVFSTGVSAQVFPVCSLHPGLSWQPLHLFCLASQLPPCFIVNAFFFAIFSVTSKMR